MVVVEFGFIGGLLQVLHACVDLECLTKVFGSLCVQTVVSNAAKECTFGVSVIGS